MDQEFSYQPSMAANDGEMHEANETQFEMIADNENSSEAEVNGEYNQLFMNEAYGNSMYHLSPLQNEAWMRAGEEFRRPPAHHGSHGGGGRPRPGYNGPFYGGGVPFLGGLASGLLFGTLFSPYGGYGGYGGYYPYYYQPPYYPYYPYY